MSAARERELADQQDPVNDEAGQGDVDEHIASVDNEEEVFEDVESTPPHPGRSRFNLTNIGEENSFLEESRAEESIMEENEVHNEEHSRMEALDETSEEAVTSPDQSLVRRARSSVRQSYGMTRQSSSRSSGIAPTVITETSGSTEVLASPTIPRLRLSLSTRTLEEAGGSSSASPRARSSRPPLMPLSSASASPQVDILKTQRHPAVVIPDLVQMNHPALPTTRHSQPCSTPFLPTPSPANKRTTAPIFSVEDFPENPR